MKWLLDDSEYNTTFRVGDMVEFSLLNSNSFVLETAQGTIVAITEDAFRSSDLAHLQVEYQSTALSGLASRWLCEDAVKLVLPIDI